MQEEGIVVKDLTSPWKMNDRGTAWQKLKPGTVVQCHSMSAATDSELAHIQLWHQLTCPPFALTSPCADYVETPDIDAVIVGVHYGTGRRGGQLAEWTLGLAMGSRADDKPPTEWLTFCRCSESCLPTRAAVTAACR
jgi:DNA ligase 4